MQGFWKRTFTKGLWVLNEGMNTLPNKGLVWVFLKVTVLGPKGSMYPYSRYLSLQGVPI